MEINDKKSLERGKVDVQNRNTRFYQSSLLQALETIAEEVPFRLQGEKHHLSAYNFHYQTQKKFKKNIGNIL
jgi:hypothetical protein